MAEKSYIELFIQQYTTHHTSRSIMRIQQHKKLNFTGQIIYIGMDIGKRFWKICIYTAAGEYKLFTTAPSVKQLVTYLHTWFPGAGYHAAYEIGYCGFWICDALNRAGIQCIVVHPADIPTSDKEHAFKTDARDARKIARMLRAGELVAIYVPSQQALQDRTWVRSRYELVKKQTRCKNQIKSRLAFFGIELPEEQVQAHWSKAFLAWLDGLASETIPQLAILLRELRFLREQIVQVTRQIRLMATTDDHYKQDCGYLIGVTGISTVSAMILLTELVEIKRFKSFDTLASYCGIVPGEHSSSEKNTNTGISRRRNSFLRYILIEAAWTAARKDPALIQAFTRLCKNMKATDAIIRIARKLLARIYWVLRHHQPYVVGHV